MTTCTTLELDFHIATTRRGRKTFKPGGRIPNGQEGSVPRIARLMALAIQMEEMVRSGEAASYAELARLGHVTRARVSQIVDLLNLAPDIQERLLFLPNSARERDAIAERRVRQILRTRDWNQQREQWLALSSEL